MTVRRFGSALCLVAMLAACGGGGGGGSGGGAPSIGSATPTPSPTPVVTPTPTAAATCSLRDRQDWVRAQMTEWYLFPETLPATLDPAPFTSVDSYLDALTATARSQRRDRYFTYVTSIREEDAYYDSGSSAGYGFRLALDQAGRLLVSESFEDAPALTAGIDRGTQIQAIGTSAATLRDVSAILAAQGTDGLVDALGPDTAGTARTFRVQDPAGGVRVVTVAKSDFTLTPVSARYGAKIIEDGGQRYGYVNLRTFISTADPALRAAFAQFRAAGVTQIVVDLRYNGGGLVSIAELFGDLLGRARSTADVFSYTTFRPEKSAENETRFFAPQPESIAASRIAFIGTGGTASASELVVNAFTPYLHANAALIGTNTYGKPVGQIALDREQCDDRLRVIAFATQNAARNGNYFDGLATTVEASCQAADDLTYPMGDPREASTRAAIDFLQGRSCTRIPTGSVSTAAARTLGVEPMLNRRHALLTPARPDTVQREVPGAF